MTNSSGRRAGRVPLNAAVIFIKSPKGWMKWNIKTKGAVINHDLPGQSLYWPHAFSIALSNAVSESDAVVLEVRGDGVRARGTEGR